MKELIIKYRKLIGLTMDVIVGFPGEKKDDFDRTLRFVREIRPSRLHVFGYSDRKGTASSKMRGKVRPDVIKERVACLIGLGKELEAEFRDRFIGREVEVLVERKNSESRTEGYTGEYLRTTLDGFSGSGGKIVKTVINPKTCK